MRSGRRACLLHQLALNGLVLAVEDCRGLLVILAPLVLADDSLFLHHPLEALDSLLKVLAVFDVNACQLVSPSSPAAVPQEAEFCHKRGKKSSGTQPRHSDWMEEFLTTTSWAEDSWIVVAETSVIFAFSCSSGMLSAPQLHIVWMTLLVVWSTLSCRWPA